MICWLGGAEIFEFIIIDFEVFGIGNDLFFAVAKGLKVADGDIFQAVAGGANLRIHLQPTLKLVLIPCAKGTFERELEVLDVAVAAGGMSAASKTECHEGRKGKFLEHHFFGPSRLIPPASGQARPWHHPSAGNARRSRLRSCRAAQAAFR